MRDVPPYMTHPGDLKCTMCYTKFIYMLFFPLSLFLAVYRPVYYKSDEMDLPFWHWCACFDVSHSDLTAFGLAGSLHGNPQSFHLYGTATPFGPRALLSCSGDGISISPRHCQGYLIFSLTWSKRATDGNLLSICVSSKLSQTFRTTADTTWQGRCST